MSQVIHHHYIGVACTSCKIIGRKIAKQSARILNYIKTGYDFNGIKSIRDAEPYNSSNIWLSEAEALGLRQYGRPFHGEGVFCKHYIRDRDMICPILLPKHTLLALSIRRF